MSDGGEGTGRRRLEYEVSGRELVRRGKTRISSEGQDRTGGAAAAAAVVETLVLVLLGFGIEARVRQTALGVSWRPALREGQATFDDISCT